jgi:hypothetical protein
VFQEAPDPTAAVASVVLAVSAGETFAHAAGPRVTAAVFVPVAVKVMVSVHIDNPLLRGDYRYI